MSIRLRQLLFSLIIIVASFPAKASAPIFQLNLEGTIHEGTVQTIQHALDAAKKDGAQALLIILDTPGGLLESTRKIVKLFLNEDFPIIVYVSPTGSRAGSAGTFITMSAHIAAMAPGTNIGAAHPVTATGKDPEEGGKHMAEKIENDTVAFIQSIAKQRNRNADWAQSAVVKSASIVETEAKKMNVIDEIAPDIKTLLKQVDGRTIQLHTKQVKLDTASAPIVVYTPDMKTRVVNFLADPTVMMILMTIIGLGLYAEFSHPGLIFPAAAAVISIFLLLIANSVISMTWVGTILIFLGFTCLFLELYIVSFGMLTIGGLALFIVGSLLLFDPSSSDLSVPKTLIWSISAGVAVVATIITVSIGRTIRQPEIMGPLAMIGKRTKLIQASSSSNPGKIFLDGEYWNAQSTHPIEAGHLVEITEVNGLTVHIKKVT